MYWMDRNVPVGMNVPSASICPHGLEDLVMKTSSPTQSVRAGSLGARTDAATMNPAKSAEPDMTFSERCIGSGYARSARHAIERYPTGSGYTERRVGWRLLSTEVGHAMGRARREQKRRGSSEHGEDRPGGRRRDRRDHPGRSRNGLRGRHSEVPRPGGRPTGRAPGPGRKEDGKAS